LEKGIHIVLSDVRLTGRRLLLPPDGNDPTCQICKIFQFVGKTPSLLLGNRWHDCLNRLSRLDRRYEQVTGTAAAVTVDGFVHEKASRADRTDGARAAATVDSAGVVGRTARRALHHDTALHDPLRLVLLPAEPARVRTV
jgi:hypothetical protein